MSGRIDLTDRIIAMLPRLRRFAWTLTRHQDDGDDLVQATVERALVRSHSFRENSRLDSWMFKIMQNLWIDQLRSRRTHGTETPDIDLAALPGQDGRVSMEDRRTLRATLDAAMRLPEDQRAVVVLVIVEGFSYREAADVLEVPIGTVMSRLSRARLALVAQVFGDRDLWLPETRQ